MMRHSSGKGSRATTGGGLPLRVCAGIDDDAAVLEAGYADAGPAAARQQRRVAVDVERQVDAAYAARRRRQARSACRSRGRRGAGSPVRSTRRCWARMPRCLQSVARCAAARSLSGPSTEVSPERDSLTTVSGWLSGSPRLPNRRPALPLGIEKTEMETGGHAYGNGIRHLPPVGCIIHRKFRCPHS